MFKNPAGMCSAAPGAPDLHIGELLPPKIFDQVNPVVWADRTPVDLLDQLLTEFDWELFTDGADSWRMAMINRVCGSHHIQGNRSPCPCCRNFSTKGCRLLTLGNKDIKHARDLKVARSSESTKSSCHNILPRTPEQFQNKPGNQTADKTVRQITQDCHFLGL